MGLSGPLIIVKSYRYYCNYLLMKLNILIKVNLNRLIYGLIEIVLINCYL